MSTYTELATANALPAKELSPYAPTTEPAPHHHCQFWSYSTTRGGWVKIKSEKFQSADAAEMRLEWWARQLAHDTTILFRNPGTLVYQVHYTNAPIDKVEVVACDRCNHS